MGEFTTFLFARPSFWEGVARALDLGGTLTQYNRAIDGRQADYLAMKSDWMAVGNDLRTAMGAFEREHPSS